MGMGVEHHYSVSAAAIVKSSSLFATSSSSFALGHADGSRRGSLQRTHPRSSLAFAPGQGLAPGLGLGLTAGQDALLSSAQQQMMTRSEGEIRDFLHEQVQQVGG